MRLSSKNSHQIRLSLRNLAATAFCAGGLIPVEVSLIYSSIQEEGSVPPAQTELKLQIFVAVVDGGGVEGEKSLSRLFNLCRNRNPDQCQDEEFSRSSVDTLLLQDHVTPTGLKKRIMTKMCARPTECLSVIWSPSFSQI